MKSNKSSKSSKPKSSLFILFFMSLIIFLLTLSFKPEVHRLDFSLPLHHTSLQTQRNPNWFDIVLKAKMKSKLKLALVNMIEVKDNKNASSHDHHNELSYRHDLAETIHVNFERVNENVTWKDLFPEWIDEDERWGTPSCPEIPMPPSSEDYRGLDAVVAQLPCRKNEDKMKRRGTRDVFRLQVNLVVANLALRAWKDHDERRDDHRVVYVVFIGECVPMVEVFRCDDLVHHEHDEYRLYRPDLRRLKEKVVDMPFGSCKVSLPTHYEAGKEQRRTIIGSESKASINPMHQTREAYVTVLHSRETYVCGAIALAQSIIHTNSTKDLILLADTSITPSSIAGLRAAGWKIKRIKRIMNPNAEKTAYNKWNYSKLRIWQLTEYDKIIFIDADFIILRNIDEFFRSPQISAAGNDKHLFNSGIMLVEPSECMFRTLMEKIYELDSYNEGDQGFLNEVFTWWHRWPKKMNRLKFFDDENDKKRDVPDDTIAIHYLGLKPWICNQEHDCNWYTADHQSFASNIMHQMWWDVHGRMPKRLQGYCTLTEKMNARIRKWRARGYNL